MDAVVQTKVRLPRAPSMPVERLDSLLDAVWRYRLGLVVAPAGSGKTTLLARFGARARGPVGWYRAEGWDSDEQALIRHLQAALGPQLGQGAEWRSVADVANALDAWRGERVLLVIDDLHTLEGTPAEAAIERLVEYAPATVTVVAASRVPPRFNLPRLRVSGALVEIGSDDLRFRSWEVERLFRNFYGEPLPPEELARLARRTEGWAAGLQLFHLATRGRGPDERRRVLAALGPSSRLMRDYLTRNVLDALPATLRRFLVETSVLGRLSAATCDALLGSGDSSDMLAELEHRNLFTQALPEEGVYRYHEVLRSHLQGVLLEEVGEERARDKFRRAARLLAGAGALPEALEAYCRAEDWEQAQALVGRHGGQVGGASTAWIDALPQPVLLHDPWLLLASARRLRAEGRFAEAVMRYTLAEAAFHGSEAGQTCRRERTTISAWLDPDRQLAGQDAASMLRMAVTREPLAVAAQAAALGTDGGRLVAGLCELIGGHIAIARQQLAALAEDEEADVFSQVAAGLASAIADLLAGLDHGSVAVEGAVASAESLGLEWLARLGRASLALTGSRDAIAEAQALAVACGVAQDRWGEALARLFVCWGGLRTEMSPADIDDLGDQLRALGAPALEAWARGIAALAATQQSAPDARQTAVQAEAVARSAGVPGARLLGYLALAECGAEDAEEYGDLAINIARETGLAPPPVRPVAPPPVGWQGHASSPVGGSRGVPANGLDRTVQPATAPLRIHLLGGFELALDGQPMDLAGVRPRVRSLLRLLSLHAGAPVHHEAVEAALWPDADATGGTRNLHVAVAALRRALEPTAARSGFQLIRREGDAYLLALPQGSYVDVQRFEHALAVGRAAVERGDGAGARQAFTRALAEYRGELLPEEGPAEWVTERRELLRLAAVEAAQGLAELLLRDGDPEAAARICAAGLRIERYHDPLWRLLIRARDQAGDMGAAQRARLGYGQMLAELDLDVSSAAAGPPA